jgi:membrane protein required for colicin V production
MDILIAIVMLLNLVYGWRRKLIRQLLSLIGTIGASVLAGKYFELVGGALQVVLRNPDLAKISSFLLIFLAVTLIVNLLISFLHRIAELFPLYWLNSMGGLVLGGLKGVIMIGVFLTLFERFPLGKIPGLIDNSALAFYFQHFAQLILAFTTYTYYSNLKKLFY